LGLLSLGFGLEQRPWKQMKTWEENIRTGGPFKKKVDWFINKNTHRHEVGIFPIE